MHYNAARPHQGIAQRVPDSQHHPPRVTALSGALPGNARQTDSYVIAVTNQKDGVGKTMVTLSLPPTPLPRTAVPWWSTSTTRPRPTTSPGR